MVIQLLFLIQEDFVVQGYPLDLLSEEVLLLPLSIQNVPVGQNVPQNHSVDVFSAFIVLILHRDVLLNHF